MPGLGVTYGRGGATTNLMDLQNADCILIQGSNMAEAHPVGFRHPMIAREKGAKLIHVDPRFTRTSAMCDIYAPIRPGTDIAFLGRSSADSPPMSSPMRWPWLPPTAG